MASLPRPIRPLRRARRRGQPAPVTDENAAPPGLSLEAPAPQNNGGANPTEVAAAMGTGQMQAFFFPGHGSVGASIVRISMPIQTAQTQPSQAPQVQANETFPIEAATSATATMPMAPKSPWFSDPGYTPWTLFSPGTLDRMVEGVVGRRAPDSKAGPSRLLDLPSLLGTPSPEPMRLPPFPPTTWGVDDAEERLQPRKRRVSAQGGEGPFNNSKRARTSLHPMDFGKASLATSADTPNGGASTSRVEATRPSVVESDGGDALPKAGGNLVYIKSAESAVVELKGSDGQGAAKGNKANTSSEAAADESLDAA